MYDERIIDGGEAVTGAYGKNERDLPPGEVAVRFVSQLSCISSLFGACSVWE